VTLSRRPGGEERHDENRRNGFVTLSAFLSATSAVAQPAGQPISYKVAVAHAKCDWGMAGKTRCQPFVPLSRVPLVGTSRYSVSSFQNRLE
jgi:hypothetical protein